jgi:hypothetical protein
LSGKARSSSPRYWTWFASFLCWWARCTTNWLKRRPEEKRREEKRREEKRREEKSELCP